MTGGDDDDDESIGQCITALRQTSLALQVGLRKPVSGTQGRERDILQKRRRKRACHPNHATRPRQTMTNERLGRTAQAGKIHGED